MSKLTKEFVMHIADLSRLAFNDEEIEKLTDELNAIVQYAEQLNELDTSNVEPTTHAVNIRNVMREDVPEPGLPVEEVLKNAPDHKDGQIRVPSILE